MFIDIESIDIFSPKRTRERERHEGNRSSIDILNLFSGRIPLEMVVIVACRGNPICDAPRPLSLIFPRAKANL